MEIGDSGVPQGSPLSPTLLSFYTVDLLEEFVGSKVLILPQFSSELVEVVMYVDDGSIRATSSSIKINCHILQIAYQRIHD